jgi:hypothetical protein
MYAARKLAGSAAIVLTIGARAGPAAAEPKNQLPFTRVTATQSVDPRPEPKNIWPFVGTGPPAAITTSTSSGGIDWTLGAWIALAVITVGGGAYVFARGVLLAARKPA